MGKKQQEKQLRAPAVSVRPLWWFLFLTPFAFGMYHEFTSCLASVFLGGYCLVFAHRQKQLRFRLSVESVAVTLIVFGYLFASFWAVDSGMAWTGFLKFFPLLPFWYLWTQLESPQRREMFSSIPLSGIVMTLLSYPARWIPSLEPFFFASDRLGGFFQYSNSFALFLLLGIIVLAFDGHKLWQRLIGMAVLLFGILATGSRTVFFVLIAVVLILCIGNRKIRWPLLGITAGLVVISVLVVVMTGNTQTVGRFLTTSLSSSTLLGRFLYYLDALPVIARHPFGLGYLGYFYMQPEFQTGVYVVRYIHNEYLQLFLDIGWIPAVGFIAALVKSFFSRKNDFFRRVLMAAIGFHIFFDFDLQYLSVYFVLLMALDCESGKEKQFALKRAVQYAMAGITCVLSGVFLYFSYALFAAYRGDHEKAVELYPQHTESQVVLLAEAPTPKRAEILADQILEQNPYVPLAYDAKALISVMNGDYASMIAYKDRSIGIARYTAYEYVDYYNLLRRALEACEHAGDSTGAALCREKLKALPGIMQAVEDGSSSLAWKIDDKPALTLPDEALNYIAEL